ncbi:MAG: CotH kinase family protein [Clostridia bacterium]|nr:CotH kinase family protein [Clostridia bacterium]
MRKNLLKTGLIVVLMLVLLAPLAMRLSSEQQSLLANNAEHVVKPLIDLYARSAANRADTPLQPMMELESIWALEDARSEAAQPLVSGMRNGSSVLGYDAASQTFYCTIGLDFANSEWPVLELFAQSADETAPVHVVWVDDYAFDDPAAAVAEGYRYELFAYTQTEFQYFGLVFTGLPIVTLHSDAEHIRNNYVPACVSISSADDPSFTSIAQIHRRGGGYGKYIDKRSYRIEFQKLTHTGRAKAMDVSVLGMEPDSDWLLLANASNVEVVHNYLAFDLWNRWSTGDHLFMQQHSRMVELFLGDEYLGLYQLMQRVNVQEEILKAGGSLASDMVVRVISILNTSDRPIQDNLEYLYAPGENAQKAFRVAQDYRKINDWLDERHSDEEFIEFVENHVDVENFISFYLFSQIAGLTADNVLNNIYVYMLWEDGKYVFHVGPWDMDCAFFYGYFDSDPSTSYRFVQNFDPAVRMLDLNIMNCRKLLHEMYQQRCETILSDEAVEQWISSVESTIAASGAYQREMEKWYGMPSNLYLSELLAFEKEQIALTREYFEERWPIP